MFRGWGDLWLSRFYKGSIEPIAVGWSSPWRPRINLISWKALGKGWSSMEFGMWNLKAFQVVLLCGGLLPYPFPFCLVWKMLLLPLYLIIFPLPLVSLLFFYAYPKFIHRVNLWEFLKDIGTNFNGPWLCIGDFNEIASIWEKQGEGVLIVIVWNCLITLFQIAALLIWNSRVFVIPEQTKEMEMMVLERELTRLWPIPIGGLNFLLLKSFMSLFVDQTMLQFCLIAVFLLRRSKTFSNLNRCGLRVLTVRKLFLIAGLLVFAI